MSEIMKYISIYKAYVDMTLMSNQILEEKLQNLNSLRLDLII